MRGATARYGTRTALSQVTLELSAPGLVAIGGPNGAGKSTLLRVLAGLLPLHSGECSWVGRPLKQWSRRELARQISFVPQTLQVDFPFTVEQVVAMGRTPFGIGLFESAADHEAVESALTATDTLYLRGRAFGGLSGGERQRVILAAAMAQSPRVLLLDEPTTFLDLAHQVSLYEFLRSLCGQGLLVVCVTHDLNFAAAYADRLLLLHDGQIRADGSPATVITPEVIEQVFGVTPAVHLSAGGKPWMVYGG